MPEATPDSSVIGTVTVDGASQSACDGARGADHRPSFREAVTGTGTVPLSQSPTRCPIDVPSGRPARSAPTVT